MADVKLKLPNGQWVSLVGAAGATGSTGSVGATGSAGASVTGATGAQGPQGNAGVDGRSVQVFQQAGEPGAALAGDIWVIP